MSLFSIRCFDFKKTFKVILSEGSIRKEEILRHCLFFTLLSALTMFVVFFSHTVPNMSSFFLILVIIASAYCLRIESQQQIKKPAQRIRCSMTEQLREDIPIISIAEEDILKQLVQSESNEFNNSETCSLRFIEKEEVPSIPNYPGKDTEWPQFSSLFAQSLAISAGGEWKPDNCKSPFLVAIIIPFRNRKDNLRNFLQYIHPFLQRQNIHYKIYVIEQSPELSFNKGALFNAGFIEAMKDESFPCVILHDVDLLPLHPNNIYACSTRPRHMSVIHKYKIEDKIIPKLKNEKYFGGVVAMLSDHYKLLNGFSNKFWKWGGEDDDFYNRVLNAGLQAIRYDSKISSYYPLFHEEAERNPDLQKVYWDGFCLFHQGLNTTKYAVISRFNEKLCTRIVISL